MLLMASNWEVDLRLVVEQIYVLDGTANRIGK